ncbi:MAG TPA: glycosyltransferase family 4 protein [Opitutaceae bacterium]|nr:glycosyltransferase family 4 protein [Opitutaceae bacterium]
MSDNLANSVRRVLLTADSVGGVWTYATTLCREFERRDIEVVLALMGPAMADDQRRSLPPNVTLCENQFRLEWMEAPWDDVRRAGDWLLGLERRHAPDVVHLNSYAHGALPWRAPTIAVAHSCVLSWWREVRGEDAPPEWRRYAEEVRAGLAGVQRVVAPTRWMAAAVQELHGPLPHIEVVSNGLEARADGTREKEPFILGVGRLWDEAKNYRLLTRTAQPLPWPVRLAGDARSPDGEAAVFDGFELLGRLAPEAVGELYDRASIFVLPARYEPFGLAVLEAAQAGCALVLGDIPSLRENWQDAAVFVSPDDPEAFRAELCRLAAGSLSQRQLGDAARKRAAEFTAQRMAESYLAIYAALRPATATAAPASLAISR